MQRALVIVSLVVSAGVVVGTSDLEPRHPTRSSEVTRLRAHFDAVDAELRARDVSGLAAAQQDRRALLTTWLRDYRNSGSFPVNDKFAAPAPFFRDSQGTLCAMAYLIHRSGRSDIVDKVEATGNNAYIAELADDPALIAWLDSSGLSVAEAARIQPAYGGGGGNLDDDIGIRPDFNVSPILLGGASLATTAFSVMKPSYVSAAMGLAAGAVSIGVAAKHSHDNGRTDKVAGTIMGLGGLAVGAGVYGLIEARRDQLNSGRNAEGRSSAGRNRVSMTFAPDFDVRTSDTRLGFRVAGKF